LLYCHSRGSRPHSGRRMGRGYEKQLLIVD
jgi:hypothetical protein